MRVASPVGAGRLTRRRLVLSQDALLLALLIACSTLGACTRQVAIANEVSIELSLRPTPLVAGVPAAGELALRDGARRLVRGATVRVVAHMSHPGMAPVVATLDERPDGVHDVHLEFTMAGDWVMHVTGALPDGRSLDTWLDVPGVQSAD